MFFKFNVSELFQLRKFLDSIFLFFPIIYSNHFDNSNSKKNIPTDVATSNSEFATSTISTVL